MQLLATISNGCINWNLQLHPQWYGAANHDVAGTHGQGALAGRPGGIMEGMDHIYLLSVIDEKDDTLLLIVKNEKIPYSFIALYLRAIYSIDSVQNNF